MRSIIFILLLVIIIFAVIPAQQNTKTMQDKFGQKLVLQMNTKTGSAHRVYGKMPNIKNYGFQPGSLAETSIKNLSDNFFKDYSNLLNIDPAQMKMKKVETNGKMWFITYRQEYNNVPVFGAEIGYTINGDGDIIALGADSYNNISVSTIPKITSSQAVDAAQKIFSIDNSETQNLAELTIYPQEADTNTIIFRLTWKVHLISAKTLKNITYFIDAENGQLITQQNNIRDNVNGAISGSYWPVHANDTPVSAVFKTTQIHLHNAANTYTNDVNSDNSGNYTFSIPNSDTWYIDFPLQDTYAKAVEYSTSNTVIRTQQFTGTTATINQNWGATDGTSVRWLTASVHDKFKTQFSFTGTDYQMTGYINARNPSDNTDANGWADRSHIAFGHEGSQPWARSSDVVYHEYTHNVIYNIYGYFIGSPSSPALQGTAMDEGLADYFACTFNNDAVEGEDVGVNRNLSNTKKYPDNYDSGQNADPHENGLIISGACWSMRQSIGASTADNLVFTALQMSPHAYNFSDFLNNIIIADYNNYSSSHDYQIRTAFSNHGITTPYNLNVISNTTWFGNCTVNNSLAVNSGVTLTINPGAVITFQNSSSLAVNGTLNATGNYGSNPITFNFVSPNSSNQNGIILNSGSGNSTIFYCIVRNAYRGIYENGVSVNILSSAISNCSNGIYLYNSSPQIGDNSIHDNSYAGICLTSSSPLIYSNNIDNNSQHGVYCTTSSNPSFAYVSSQDGRNNIRNNGNGIFCWNNSLPMVGRYSPSNGGYNNITGNTHSIYNMSTGSIYAETNWWGTTNPGQFGIAGTGGISTSYYLNSVATTTQPPLYKTNGSSVEDVPMLSELDKAYRFIANNNLSEARNICLNLINNYPDYSVSYNALNLLKDTYSAAEINNAKDTYKLLFNKNQKNNLNAMAGLILSDIDKENKLNQINDVINNYKNEGIVELALFDKFVYYYFEKNDLQNALAVSSELDKEFPLSQGSIGAHQILGDTAYYNADLYKKQAQQNTVAQTPTEYTLYDNYPNPFNPTTIIEYQLPKDGFVSLKVYDILGRVVRTLVNESKKVGIYSVSFDASKLASGVYIYQLRVNAGGTNNIVLTKKMQLLK